MNYRNVKSWTIFIGLFGVILTYSCNDSLPLGVYDEFADSTSVGRLEVSAIQLQQVDSVSSQEVNTGLSLSLFLGNAGNSEALILIKFTDLPDSGTFNVSEAKLRLAGTDFTGEADETPFSANVHVVNTEWQESQVTYSELGQGFFDAQPVGGLTVVPEDTQSVEASIAPGIVQDWVLNQSENFGLLIQAESPAFLQRFSSRNASSDKPVLTIYQESSEGVRDSVIVTAGADASILRQNTEAAPGPIYIGNGVEYRSIFHFDVSEIPEEATITRALLKLQVDHENSFLDDGNAVGFNVLTLLKPVDDPLDLSVDPDTTIGNAASFTLNGLGVVDTSQTLTAAMRSVVQPWVDGRTENIGLALLSLSPTSNPYLAAIHTTNTDPSKAPKLEIHYSTPPGFKKENGDEK